MEKTNIKFQKLVLFAINGWDKTVQVYDKAKKGLVPKVPAETKRLYQHLFLTSGKDGQGNPIVVSFQLENESDYREFLREGVSSFDSLLAHDFPFSSTYDVFKKNWRTNLLSVEQVKALGGIDKK